MKNSKKGFILATTLILMVCIFSLSSLLLVMVHSFNFNKNVSMKRLENNLIIKQVAIDYVNFEENNFIKKYQDNGYFLENKNNIINLSNNESRLVLTIDKTVLPITNFYITKIDSDKKLLEIQKNIDSVVKWIYY